MSPLLTRRNFLIAAGAGAAAAAGYGAFSNELETVRVSPPRALRGVRIAILTDMHAPHYMVENDAMVHAVEAFAPHLVLILGDSIEKAGDEPRVRFYGRLPASAGKFAILGNWEYWGLCDMTRLTREYESAGVRLLVNERVPLAVHGSPVELIGLDDLRGGRPDYGLLATAPDEPRRTRRIVMAHCPASHDRIVEATAVPALTLSGHTHGGQIAPFGFAPYTPSGSGRYVAGWYHDAAGNHLYVSRGLGNSGVPFRIGTRPELTFMTV